MYKTVAYFQNEYQQDLNLVNEVIQEQMLSDVTLINQISTHIVASGGKRLRPITLILAGKSLGSTSEMLYRQAAMIEFIHTSTLLHDDVVDESEFRRGQKTTNNVFGNAATILVGDFLYTRAFQLMVSSNEMRLMQIMSDATNIISTGEIMQLINIRNSAITKNEYLQVIENKTAKLFEASAQVGAIIANASSAEENALKHYAMCLGLIFQIVDDILDYSGDPKLIGKNVGDDLAEGKPTLPLIYLLQHGSDEAKKVVRHALETASCNSFTEIYHHVSHSSALEYCYEEAEKLVMLAQKALQPLPQNQYTETLAQLVAQSVNRNC